MNTDVGLPKETARMVSAQPAVWLGQGGRAEWSQPSARGFSLLAFKMDICSGLLYTISWSLLSVAVINAVTKCNLGRKEFISSYYESQVRIDH